MPFNTSSSQADFTWLEAATKRLQAGEAAALIAETLEALAHDERNTNLLHIVSLAYSYQGQGDRAEPYSRRALEEILKDREAAPLRVEMACVSLYDSLIAQAKYVEAAQTLDPMLNQVPHTNSMLLLIAWACFLAEDAEGVQNTLRRSVPSDPSTTGSDAIAAALPSFHYLIGPYMEYALELYPPRRQPHPLSKPLFDMLARSALKGIAEGRMQIVTGCLERLEDEARRQSHTPYGRRLSEIVARMRPLDWLDEYDKRKVWG